MSERKYIELSDKLKKWIRTIPQTILIDLWAVGQEGDHTGWANWDMEHAFWQEISCAMRECNNPDPDGEVWGT